VPNGIDKRAFIDKEFKKNIDVSGAGSFIALKKYDIFISVVKKLKEKIPSINAVMCGAGPELVKLKQLAEKLELNNNISFAGELHYGIYLIVHRFDIFEWSFRI
jgi:glycosyltransferase involved in cell wall biosynthesis